ncbi:MAG: dolichol kinase [Halobacteriales archaeon]
MQPEVARRLVHATGSVVPLAYLVDLLTWGQVRTVLLVAIALALVIEAVRLLVGLELPLVERMIRGYEEDYLAGYALYIFGGGVTGLVFEPSIAVPAILMLTIADPISGLLGGDELRTVKHPHVLAVTFIVCLGLAWWSLKPTAAVAAALVATLADGVKPVIRGYVIDDNLTIPLGAATAAFVVIEYGPGLL